MPRCVREVSTASGAEALQVVHWSRGRGEFAYSGSGLRTQLLVSSGAHAMAEARWQPENMSFYPGPDTIPGKQISCSPAPRRPESSGPGRARLSRAERGAVQVAAVGGGGFFIFRVATGLPSTAGYLSSPIVIRAGIRWVRPAAPPGVLAAGLAVAPLAGLAR